MWDYFATATIPRPAEVEAVLEVLRGSGEPMSVPALEAQTGVRRTRVELMLKQLAVDEVVDRVEGGWLATERPWSFDAEHYDGVVAVRRREADIMRDYIAGSRCLMELLQESLDDPHAAPCGRCSVCRETLPEGLRPQPSTETVAAVSGVLKGHVQVLEPRKMWPGGDYGSRGRIQPGETAEEGRVLDPRRRPRVGRRHQPPCGEGTRRPPATCSTGWCGLLSGWRSSWATRPDLVCGLSVAGRPQLVASVTDHVAGVGRLERLDLGAHPPPTDDVSSAQEAAWWRDHLGPAIAGPRGQRPDGAARRRPQQLRVAGDRGRGPAAAGRRIPGAPAAAAPHGLTRWGGELPSTA